MRKLKKTAIEKSTAEAPSVNTALVVADVPRETLATPLVAVDAATAQKKVTDDREQTLLETDLTRKKLFQTISDGLEAMTSMVDGDGKVIGQVPNHTVRVKYAGLAADILGEKISGNDSKNVNMINIYLPEQLKQARARYQKSGFGISDLRDEDGTE